MSAPEPPDFDVELADLPADLRWREWMARVEAVLFAQSAPVSRGMLASLVGRDCALDPLIEDIQLALVGRPYEIVRAGAGWQFRSRRAYGAVIRHALDPAAVDPAAPRDLGRNEALVLAVIAYQQPITRGAIARLTGREVSRDLIARLHRRGLIARGPRSPEPGAPYSYVTAAGFLLEFGLASLRDLPDLEAMEDAGLLQRGAAVIADLPIAADPEDL